MILYDLETNKEDDEFISVKKLEKNIKSLAEEDKDTNFGIILVDFDLDKKKDSKTRMTCKKRKELLTSSLTGLISNKIGKGIKYLRKIKNTLKYNRNNKMNNRTIKNN